MPNCMNCGVPMDYIGGSCSDCWDAHSRFEKERRENQRRFLAKIKAEAAHPTPTPEKPDE